MSNSATIDQENEVVKTIQANLQFLKETKADNSPGELEEKWSFLTSSEPSRFLNADLSLKKDVLQDFRNQQVFIPDLPTCNLTYLNPRNLASGGHRAERKLLKENVRMLEERGYIDLLEKYPVSKVGNPNTFTYKGYECTHRWMKHIYSLGLFRDHLESDIGEEFINMDIGSSYGIFAYLLKSRFPKSRHILVDFPEQLILANYFMGRNFPDAKIASFKEIEEQGELTREFVEQYDFVLVPWFYYDRFAPKATDMFMNFASFGEMSREWFDYYLKNEPFSSAKYLFLENRVVSMPTYKTDLTILDYPLDQFNKMHFGIWPFSHHYYDSKFKFFMQKLDISSNYFEFIGKRK